MNTFVAATSLATGLGAGLSVLLLPRKRSDTDPTSRLSKLASPCSTAPGAEHSTPRLTSRQGATILLAAWTTSRAARRRNAESARLAPVAADLLAACLASGAPPDQAAEAVGNALHPAVPQAGVAPAARQAAFDLASRFHEVAALLRLGGHPVTCWRPLGIEPGLLPLSQAAARACLTGAPPAEAVAWTADDLRAVRHSAGTAAARQAGVRAVAPLAGCFLPAFLLIGVVPVVIGLAQRLMP